MQFLSAPSRLSERDFKCLPFKMADGVRPVTQQKTLSTNMERVLHAKMTVKAARGQTMFI